MRGQRLFFAESGRVLTRKSLERLLGVNKLSDGRGAVRGSRAKRAATRYRILGVCVVRLSRWKFKGETHEALCAELRRMFAVGDRLNAIGRFVHLIWSLVAGKSAEGMNVLGRSQRCPDAGEEQARADSMSSSWIGTAMDAAFLAIPTMIAATVTSFSVLMRIGPPEPARCESQLVNQRPFCSAKSRQPKCAVRR